MNGMFGRRVRRKDPREEMPLLPVGEAMLDTPDPLSPRIGQFGAKKIPRNQLRAVGAALSDVSSGLRGSGLGYTDQFLGDEAAAQETADWGAMLDDMDLAPEVRTFADANPAAFKEHQFKQGEATRKSEEALGILDGLNLPPEVLARAKLNPAAFMEQIGKEAGTTREKTYQDPITGEWVVAPELYDNGGYTGLLTGDGVDNLTQRPLSHQEANERNRIGVEAQKAAEAARGNVVGEDLTREELRIRELNAQTNAANAGRVVSSPGVGGRPRAADSPFPEPMDYEYDPEDPFNGLVKKISIGPDGRYAPTDGDPQIPQGKTFPPPSFNTIEGLGDKAGPTINAEQKKMDQIDATRDSAVLLKSLSDKYITQSEGYPFGSMPWDGARQWADTRTRGLEGLNAQMALEIGKMAKGAMSDADRDWFIKAAPNSGGKPESNATFAMRANAIANNANQYTAFMKAYRAEYGVGSVAEAQRYWDMYSLANPIFDDKGDAAEKRMSYKEFFTGTPAKRDDVFQRDYPGVRGESTKPKTAAEATDDDIKKKLGLQ